MSFQNTISEDGYCSHYHRSININVIPTFGHIVNVNEPDRQAKVSLSSLSSEKSNNGEPETELSTQCPETSTLLATLPFRSRKLLKNLLLRTTSTTTSRDLDSAGDSASDSLMSHLSSS